MYIEKLSANKDSFHDVTLKNGKINIILGSKGIENKKKNNTVNGVGKTLSVKLIDYCLGCRSDAHKEICKLTDWDFKLIVNINSKMYEIIRGINDSNIVYINEKRKKVKDLTSFLEAESFNGIEDYEFLSFRSLISHNLRIPKDGYLEWYKCKKKEEDYQSLLANAYLLGLDVNLAIKKIQAKTEINNIDNSKKVFSKDPEIKQAMSGSDVRIQISNLQKEIKSLSEKMSQFNISEGYNEIKESIEKNTIKKNDLINQITKYKNTVKSIDDNLKTKVDIDAKRVEELYQEANIIFPSDMLRNLEEISQFHERLIEGRKARLIKDKQDYVKMINKHKKALLELDDKINHDMEFIRDKVSTTEYEKLQSRLTELKILLGKMQQYDSVIKQLEHKKANMQANMATDNIEAMAYIDNIENTKESLNNRFTEYVDYIYDERKYSGLDITNNDGDNKLRYDIKVEIQDDNSGGIGNVKIFCMDMLMWESSINSNIGFLYHDGCLFAETDPRQCYRMLKIASSICSKQNKQYIVNMNYDMFESIVQAAKEAEDNEFCSELNESIRLRLYDTNPTEKLLGMEIK